MPEINLLPWRLERENRHKKRSIYYIFGCILLIILVTFACNYSIYVLIEDERQSQTALQNEMMSYPKLSFESKNTISSHIWASRIHHLKKIQYKQRNLAYFFNEFSSLLPQNIYVNTLSGMQSRLFIQGCAESNVALTLLIAKIAKSCSMTSPSLIGIKKLVKNPSIFDGTFQLSFLLKYTEQGCQS